MIVGPDQRFAAPSAQVVRRAAQHQVAVCGVVSGVVGRFMGARFAVCVVVRCVGAWLVGVWFRSRLM